MTQNIPFKLINKELPSFRIYVMGSRRNNLLKFIHKITRFYQIGINEYFFDDHKIYGARYCNYYNTKRYPDKKFIENVRNSYPVYVHGVFTDEYYAYLLLKYGKKESFDYTESFLKELHATHKRNEVFCYDADYFSKRREGFPVWSINSIIMVKEKCFDGRILYADILKTRNIIL